MVAIDLEKRGRELYNVPFADFMKNYAGEIKQWWDTYGPSNWGATSDQTNAALAIAELQEMVDSKSFGQPLYMAGRLGAITKKLAEILQAKYNDRMQAGATIVAVVPEREQVASDIHVGRRIEDSRCQGGHHGYSQIHHSTHC